MQHSLPWRRAAGAAAAFVFFLGLAAQGLPSQSGWIREDVESSKGWDLAMALDSMDRPHVVYMDTNDQLKLAVRTPSGWSLEAVPEPNDIQGGTFSIAVDPATAAVHLAYRIQGSLRHARKEGSTWSFTTVDSDGLYNSLALDAGGNPHVSYRAVARNRTFLRYARWTGSEWVIQDVVQASFRGTSLVLEDGLPRISFGNTSSLRFAWSDGSTPSGKGKNATSPWTIETIDSDGGEMGSLALDAFGRFHVSYLSPGWAGSQLRYAVRDGGAWAIQAVEVATGEESLGFTTSLDLDGQGRPHIAYDFWVDGNSGECRYAHHTGSAWQLEVVDGGTDFFVENAAIAVDSNGMPHVVYAAWVEEGGTWMRRVRYARREP